MSCLLGRLRADVLNRPVAVTFMFKRLQAKLVYTTNINNIEVLLLSTLELLCATVGSVYNYDASPLNGIMIMKIFPQESYVTVSATNKVLQQSLPLLIKTKSSK